MRSAEKLGAAPTVVKRIAPTTPDQVQPQNPKGSNGLERLVEVGDQILGILDSHRKPQ